ncbi:hypothetical protein SteCoe_12617 [Stentor coeruleus]|uniref:Myb-like DNA-binding domain containing protein n=1 Tax=Stentor coeruleus TaxID=5963 RepID=A0A1R2CAI8_9CILI|nr:hypothetical protein SteCoe_12617 [Stentor coeruleus]
MSNLRNSWSQEEDEIIREIVMIQGMKKWTKIAKAIKERLGIEGRTGKQCRERWHNHLNPEINKEIWTEDEENQIFELQKQLGNKWSEIATHMPGRTDNSIKNCFYSAIRRNLRKYNKKRPESEKLKGPLKSLLKKPSTRAILMRSSDSLSEVQTTVPKAQKAIKKYLNTDIKPIDIICPTISPLPTLGMFSYPITPSTTPSIMSSKFTSCYFNFPDEISIMESMYMKNDNEISGDVIRSEQTTPRYFLPHFSPKTTFQHYFTPRNSNSQ